MDTDGYDKLIITEESEDLRQLKHKIFWQKLSSNLAGHKIYQHIKHEDFLIESKWTLEGKRQWAGRR